MFSINSYIETPHPIANDCFTEYVKENATLNVYVTTKQLYESTEGWNGFSNIVEKFIIPSEENTHIEIINETSSSEKTLIYNLNGQRVESTNKGIYIKNGKKALVK